MEQMHGMLVGGGGAELGDSAPVHGANAGQAVPAATRTGSRPQSVREDIRDWRAQHVLGGRLKERNSPSVAEVAGRIVRAGAGVEVCYETRESGHALSSKHGLAPAALPLGTIIAPPVQTPRLSTPVLNPRLPTPRNTARLMTPRKSCEEDANALIVPVDSHKPPRSTRPMSARPAFGLMPVATTSIAPFISNTKRSTPGLSPRIAVTEIKAADEVVWSDNGRVVHHGPDRQSHSAALLKSTRVSAPGPGESKGRHTFETPRSRFLSMKAFGKRTNVPMSYRKSHGNQAARYSVNVTRAYDCARRARARTRLIFETTPLTSTRSCIARDCLKFSHIRTQGCG